MMRKGIAGLAALLLVVTMAPLAREQGPAAPPAIAQALTTNHLYRVVLVTAPQPVPMGKHFELQLAIYEAKSTGKRITDGQLDVTAGMTHGMGHEFMHGMQSTPVVEALEGGYTVRGMMFHMQGPWTLRVRVREGGHSGTADLTLECCGG
jgi:hypothetical protein